MKQVVEVSTTEMLVEFEGKLMIADCDEERGITELIELRSAEDVYYRLAFHVPTKEIIQIMKDYFFNERCITKL